MAEDYNLIKTNGKEAYGVKEFIIDDISKIGSLPDDCVSGSTCLVINGAKVFMYNNAKQWIELK